MIILIILLALVIIGVGLGIGLGIGLKPNKEEKVNIKFKPNKEFRIPFSNDHLFYYNEDTPSGIYGSYDEKYVTDAFTNATVKATLLAATGVPFYKNQIDLTTDYEDYEFELESDDHVKIYNNNILRKFVTKNKWKLSYKTDSHINTKLHGSYTREKNIFKLTLDYKYKFPTQGLEQISGVPLATWNATFVGVGGLPKINSDTRYLIPLTNRFQYFIYDKDANTLKLEEDKTGDLENIYTYIGLPSGIPGKFALPASWEKWDNNIDLINMTVTTIT